MSSTEATSIEYEVDGMSCSHCEAAIREGVLSTAGVKEVKVSAETGRMRVTGSVIDEAAVIAAVRNAGYDAKSAATSCCGHCADAQGKG
ncbi:MAG: heavy-metal-associated domain-containing protein [Solirubrobacterales bacterium]|nr:heavy-metal-associated domain-containing protein [Solirubrobacterales bacterium]